MKQINKMSRLTGELEKCFNLLNTEMFNNELPTPIITVIPTPRAYAHYVPYDIWNTTSDSKREINIASGTLNRPIENIVASMLHEMCHMYNDIILNIQDTSRGGTYHNKNFAIQAQKRGLNVTKSEKYGYAHTDPTDKLIEWVLLHDELREIEMCRNNAYSPSNVGTHSNNSNRTYTPTNKNNHSIKYICPHCYNSVRATKTVNIICGDCMKTMEAIK